MRTYATNRRASFDYQILETFEAGIELNGHEVKSIRQGRINLTGAYAVVRQNEIWLINANIASFQPENAPPDFTPLRSRRLLLNRKEVKNLIGKLQDKSLTLIPLKIYSRGAWIKLELGLAKKKKKADKREKIRQREAKREIRKMLRPV